MPHRRSGAGRARGQPDREAVHGRRRRQRAELERALVAAQAASKAKSELLANISHEIHTPMNGIMGMTELTLEAELPREARGYLTMVKSSADALLEIINDAGPGPLVAPG